MPHIELINWGYATSQPVGPGAAFFGPRDPERGERGTGGSLEPLTIDNGGAPAAQQGQVCGVPTDPAKIKTSMVRATMGNILVEKGYIEGYKLRKYLTTQIPARKHRPQGDPCLGLSVFEGPRGLDVGFPRPAPIDRSRNKSMGSYSRSVILYLVFKALGGCVCN